MNKKLKKILIIVFWISVWDIAALFVASPLILASPVDVFNSLVSILPTAGFWATVGFSFLRIGIGFLCACAIGSLLGLLSYKFQIFYDFVSPMIQLIKSAPLVCIIVLLLVWFGVEFVDIIAVCLAVIPVFFFAIFTACNERNLKILNMLKLYKASQKTIWKVFEWPSIMPYFYQATQTGIGLSWKSGTTAQMIGAVAFTIGDGVYMSKLTLDSAQLLIWMFVVVFLGWASEKLLILLIKKLSAAQTASSIKAVTKASNQNINKKDVSNSCKPDRENQKSAFEQTNKKTSAIVVLDNVSKSFPGKKLIENLSLKIKPGDRVAITGPIGKGKSTLLNIILGLDDQISGKVTVQKNDNRIFSVMFQENTLLENLTVQENIEVAAQKHINIDAAIELTDSNSLAKELSGGMKRCAEIERAIIADSSVVVMDEPFAGLDEKTKQRAIKYIDEGLQSRAFILVTHDHSDAQALSCNLLPLNPHSL